MTRIKVYYNQDNMCTGFTAHGHADNTAVCTAVSVIVINTVNAIQELTDAETQVQTDDGLIDFRIISKPTNDTELLIRALWLGLQSIRDEYGAECITLEERLAPYHTPGAAVSCEPMQELKGGNLHG